MPSISRRRSTRRIVPAGVIAVVSLLVLPVAGHGAVVGSNLTASAEQNHGEYCGSGNTCTGTNLSLPAGSTATDGLTSPIDGTIVMWRVKSGSTGNPVALRVLRPEGGLSYTGAGTSTAGTTNGDVAEFITNLPIQAGDSIGLDIGNSGIVWATNGAATGVLWGTVNNFPTGLADGQTGEGGTKNTELLVQAVVEPAAGGGGNNGGGQADNTRPEITDLKAKPKKFRVGPPRVMARRAKKKAPRGTTFRYELSEPATVGYIFERGKKGRKVKGKCRKPRPRHREKPKCMRWKEVGGLEQAGTTGENSQPFSGRLDGGPLRPGRYRATLIATDGAENVSKRSRTRFRIVKK